MQCPRHALASSCAIHSIVIIVQIVLKEANQAAEAPELDKMEVRFLDFMHRIIWIA